MHERFGARKAVKKTCRWHVFRPWESPLNLRRIRYGCGANSNMFDSNIPLVGIYFSICCVGILGSNESHLSHQKKHKLIARIGFYFLIKRVHTIRKQRGRSHAVFVVTFVLRIIKSQRRCRLQSWSCSCCAGTQSSVHQNQTRPWPQHLHPVHR